MACTVLIVDDEALIRWALRELLLEEGFSVVEAGTGGEALDRASSSPIDVAIVDMRLPDMDGQTLLARLKGCRPGLVPIILSAHDPLDEGEEERRRYGVYSYVRKPFDPDAMVRLVREAAGTLA